MNKYDLKLPPEIAHSVLDILENIMNNARDDGREGVVHYVAPVFAVYAEAVIKAMPDKKKNRGLFRLHKRKRK